MYLTASSLAPWMLRRGLLDAADLVHGEFTVEQIDRQNRGFLVRRPTARPLYVKQLKTLDRFDIACIEREAFCLKLAESRDEFDSLQAAMPTFVDFDSERSAVTVELLTESRDLLQSIEQLGAIPLNVARQAGLQIAAFRSESGREFAARLDARLSSGQPPWILSFHRDQGDGWLSTANTELLRILRNDPELTEVLDAIHSGWQSSTLMHSDLKWDNVLAVAMGEGQMDCRIIDWEMVNRGDSAWDAATMLQCWWWYWILSTPPVELTTLDELIENRFVAFDEHRPSLDSFWSGCVEHLDKDESRTLLDRCIHFAAARLLQTTYELQQRAEEFPPQARVLVEMSRRFLLQPESARPFSPAPSSREQA